MRVQHLYAAKLSIHENIFSRLIDDMKPLFKKGIRVSAKPMRWSDSYWAFMDIQQITIDSRFLIAGRLYRGRDEDVEVMVLENEEVKTKIENVQNATTKSNFVFDYETEIVVFEERHGKISKNQFIEMFKKLIMSNVPEIGDLESEFLPLEESLLMEINKFSKVYAAKFELKPANWNDDEDFSDLDEELKDLKTHKAIHMYESRDGLNREARLFRKPVNMVIAGYGKLFLSGRDLEGNTKQLDSENELLSQRIEAPDEDIKEVVTSYINLLFKAISQHLGARRDG